MNKPADEKIAKLMEENAKLKNQLVCKRCGFDNKHEKYEVDQEAIKDYYKSLLAQEPFKKTYDILNGTYSITCEEPTRQLLAAYTLCWDKLDSTIVQYAPDLLSLMVINKIEKITSDGLETVYDMPMDERLKMFRGITFENIENVIPDYYQNMPQVILLAVKGVTAAFNALCLQLGEAALDENFWKGVGLN
jgi:hypothetical protein